MTEPTASLLIVEDDPEVADMLNAYFQIQGYDVMTVNWGEDCLRACQANRPDLILLDIRLPDIDGYEVAKRLRSNRRTGNIPILFLTERRQRADRLHGLELGADDYITKPFDIQELRLRVRNALRRQVHGPLTNPITDLPERGLVDEKLAACLAVNDCALLIIALANLDRFREAYGFVASDDVMRAVSMMIRNAVRELGSEDDFVGHLDVTLVLVATRPHLAADLQKRIRDRLIQSLDYFYPLKDREAGVPAADRLQIEMGTLLISEESFDTVDALKTALLRRLE